MSRTFYESERAAGRGQQGSLARTWTQALREVCCSLSPESDLKPWQDVLLRAWKATVPSRAHLSPSNSPWHPHSTRDQQAGKDSHFWFLTLLKAGPSWIMGAHNPQGGSGFLGLLPRASGQEPAEGPAPRGRLPQHATPLPTDAYPWGSGQRRALPHTRARAWATTHKCAPTHTRPRAGHTQPLGPLPATEQPLC